MSEQISVSGKTKKERYESLLPQVKALVQGEMDFIANVSNIMSALKYGMNFFWVGIYLVKDDELVLGPFQGQIACTRIKKGKGVCGIVWEENEIIIVPDTEKFHGHIACSTESKSEIVFPLCKDEKVFAVLDVDSDKLNDFDETDKTYLLEIAKLIESVG